MKENYKMFEELSTYSLEEIETEDLKQILEDVATELERRKYSEAIDDFVNAYYELLQKGVTLSYNNNGDIVKLDDRFSFIYTHKAIRPEV